MNDKPLSSRQLAFMVFLLLPGSALVYLTGTAAKQDAWISASLAIGSGLYVLYAIMQIHKLFPGQRITQICTMVLGKIPGTILNLLFLWSIFIIALSFLYDITSVLKIIYPIFPVTLFYPLIILTCCCCLYKGLIVVGHLGEIFIGLTLFFILLSFLFAIPLMDLAMLTPVFENWKLVLAGTLYSADWPFNEVVIIALFLPAVADLPARGKQIYYWYLFSALIIVLLDLQVVSILGPSLTHLYNYPLFEVFRLAGFGDFHRLEMLFFLLWFITGIFTIIIYYQGLNFITQDILGLKQYRALILPVGLCLVIFTQVMFPTEILYLSLGFKFTPVYTFPVNLLYPSIILLASFIHKQRNASRKVQTRQESAPS